MVIPRFFLITLYRLKMVINGISFFDKFFIFLTFLGRIIYGVLTPLFPFLKNKFGKLTFPINDVCIFIPEFNSKFFIRKFHDDIIVIDPNYEKEVIEEIKKFNGKVFVDVGAHIGKYSLIVARKNPNTKVIAIEPNSNTYKILEKNIKLNNLKNIIPLNLAAYYSDTKVKFSEVNYTAGISQIEKEGYGLDKNIRKKVKYKEAKKLDTILKELKIRKVDMIKIDVEGAEHAVLKGSKNILRNNRDLVILFEASDKEHFEKSEKILKKYGFKIEKISYNMYKASKI